MESKINLSKLLRTFALTGAVLSSVCCNRAYKILPKEVEIKRDRGERLPQDDERVIYRDSNIDNLRRAYGK